MTNPLDNNSLAVADYHQIEKEHQQLDRFLSDLRDTCCNLDNALTCTTCTKEKLASCRGRFSSFIYRLLEITGTHYHHEESIMLSRSHVTETYEYFRAHHQAHTDIIDELKILADACATLNQQNSTAEGYRLLYSQISYLFEEHERNFDTPFIESTQPPKSQ